MPRQLFPRITPVMLDRNPDQVCDILNRAIGEMNTIYQSIDTINNGMISIKNRISALENAPTPSYTEFVQTMLFNSANMGSTPGMCLQNCRKGFGIQSGTFPNARADWESQIANGTLHTGYPPSYLQVPVYADTGTVNGHVVVWDRGTVWEDGSVVPDGLTHYSHIIGWGELCDGVRVVHRV